MDSSNFANYVKDLEKIVETGSNRIESSVQQNVVKGSRPLKLLYVGPHISQTSGCGKISYNLLKELSKHSSWLKIVQFSTQKTTAVTERSIDSSIKVHDFTGNSNSADKKSQTQQTQAEHLLGLTEFPNVIRREEPDILLIYDNMINITRYTECLRQNNINRTFRIWVFVDQRHPFMPPPAVDIINRDSDRVFVYTKEWKSHFLELGVIRPIDVVSYGIDSSVIRVIPRNVARQSAGLPNDITVILSTHRNQPHKKLDVSIMAFVELITKFPAKNIFLLCVCDKGELGGYSLFEMFSNELKSRSAPLDYFGNRLLITSSPASYCYKDDQMNMFYNLADIGLNCADGEGFGLCPLEQMAVGIPQVVSDVIGHRDFCNSSNSLIVKSKSKFYIPNAQSPMGGETYPVNPSDVANALEQYILQDDLKKAHCASAKETAAKYTCERSVASLVRALTNAHKDLSEE